MPYDMNGQHDNRCYFCQAHIPKYELRGWIYTSGFVPPAPARRNTDDLTKEEQAHVKFKQGPTGMTATAVEERCCAPCYLREFARINPGATLPRMPRLLDQEDDDAGLLDAADQKAIGRTFVADAGEPAKGPRPVTKRHAG